jgi:hypothetical protein
MIDSKKITVEISHDNEIEESLIIEIPNDITALELIPILRRLLNFLDCDPEILQKVLKGFNIDIKNLKE